MIDARKTSKQVNEFKKKWGEILLGCGCGKGVGSIFPFNEMR